MEKYRPANGSEGECFMEEFCFQCELDRERQEWEAGKNRHPWTPEPRGCQILADTMAYDHADPKYPEEWTFDKKGEPTCTAFIPEHDEKYLETKRREEVRAAGQQELFK